MMKIVATVLLSFLSIVSCSNEDLIRKNIDTGVIRTIYDRNYDALYISSVDYIYKVDASNVSRTLAQIEWKSRTIAGCLAYQSEYKCRNHIKVLNQLNSTHIFTCGTFSYNPTCCYVDVTSFTLMRETCGKSMWRAPYNPDAEVVAAVHGDIVVTATFGGFYGDDPFLSVTSSNTQLRSKESKNFFNKPHFAGVYIKPTLSGLTHKAYVFFHELAGERTSYHSGGSPFDDEMKFTSRVGTVCLNDQGGSIWVLSKRISTFHKMSLICAARKGKYSVTYTDFTHIVQTQLIENPDDENNPLVVALFRRGKYEGGSAVCAYQFKDIQKQFETNRFWRERRSASDHKLYEYDNVEEDECTEEHLTDDRLRFKESHVVKVGFVRSKYSQPIFHDEETIFTKFSISNDNVNQPFGHHLLLTNDDGIVRRIFLHSSDLINDGNVMPEKTVLPDLYLDIPNGKTPLTLIKEDYNLVSTDRNGLTQRIFPLCGEYHDNCTRCQEDLFCVYSSSEGKCIKTENGSSEDKPECVKEEPTTVEDVPVIPQTTISTKELMGLQSRNKALKHDLELCRAQLKYMKSWTNKELTKYRGMLKNQTMAVNTCQDNLMSYSQNCIQAKSALLQKNKILQKKSRTLQRQLKEDVENVELKAKQACERSRSENMEAVCDCKTNTVSYGYGWFEEDTKQAKYFVGENRMTFDDAKKYCNKMDAQLPQISHGGFMKELITNFDSSWKFWMGFTTEHSPSRTTSNKKRSKRCLQLSTSHFWSFVHCDKLALAVCRKPNTESSNDATMSFIESVARGSQMYRLN